jgi:hypothetical protein
VRFVPEGAPLAVLRTRRVSDWAFLLLRLLAVALVGFALAGFHLRREGPPRLVVVDASRAVASIAEVRDSALAAMSGGGVLIAFDSAARRVTRETFVWRVSNLLVQRGQRGGRIRPGTVPARTVPSVRAIVGRSIRNELRANFNPGVRRSCAAEMY